MALRCYLKVLKETLIIYILSFLFKGRYMKSKKLRITRNALIIKLMSDIELLYDEVKGMLQSVEGSPFKSLKLMTSAVEK